jgi:uncharacterized protein (DUF2164 family)
MPIELPPDTLKKLQASVKRYAAESLDEDMGALKAGLLLDFFLKELAPTVYNQAIADAQAYFQARTVDLEGVCYVEEFGYWPPQRRR